MFSASPETIRREPPEFDLSFAQSPNGGTWQPAHRNNPDVFSFLGRFFHAAAVALNTSAGTKSSFLRSTASRYATSFLATASVAPPPADRRSDPIRPRNHGCLVAIHGSLVPFPRPIHPINNRRVIHVRIAGSVFPRSRHMARISLVPLLPFSTSSWRRNGENGANWHQTRQTDMPSISFIFLYIVQPMRL